VRRNGSGGTHGGFAGRYDRRSAFLRELTVSVLRTLSRVSQPRLAVRTPRSIIQSWSGWWESV
jgi:hypothetical protein